MNKKRSAFLDHLKQRIDEGQQFLLENHWAVSGTALPNVDQIEPVLQRHLGSQESPPPHQISSAASLGPNQGTAHEALGQLEIALPWYQLGQYSWRGGKQFDSVIQEPADYSARMTAGTLQLNSAICADRIGSQNRAQTLFQWAAENRSFTAQELQGFEETQQPWIVWKWTIQKAYASFCLGEYQPAHHTAEEARHWINLDSGAKPDSAAEMPLLILPTLLALIHYELDPSAANRGEAVRLLDRDAVATRNHPDHLQALFYLFNLRAKYPELAAPEDAELPPGARARQAAQACRKWTAQAGLQLDGSTDSLELLDEHIREVYGTTSEEEQRKLVLFMLGSYFGEVVRHELAGGKWNFTAAAMLAWTVDWLVGDIELQLWPFQRVHEYATGNTDHSLMDLWEETEQAYLELGLASRFTE